MEEQTSVNKDYKEAFNQGYQLSKELNLKPEILKGLSAGNYRMQAMKEGMEQYQKDNELIKAKTPDKDVIPSLDMDKMDGNYLDLSVENKDKDKNRGLDMDY